MLLLTEKHSAQVLRGQQDGSGKVSRLIQTLLVVDTTSQISIVAENSLQADLASGRLVHESRAPSLQAVIDEYRTYLKTERRTKASMAKYERGFSAFLALASQRKTATILDVNRRFVDSFRAGRVKTVPSR